MKIKTFRFTGSRNSFVNSENVKVKDEEIKIDATINDFCSRLYKVIDIQLTPIICKRHNNGGYDTVDLIYTIIYE